MIQEFKKRLGKWLVPAWILCGLAAFGIFAIGALWFTPEMIQAPADVVMWGLDAALLLLCVAGGPMALLAAWLLFALIGVLTRLVG